jgi:exo-beta-1,3-glucanase (GH17 family)
MRKARLPYAKAICYSGFRNGQSPETGTFPTYDEVKEDLEILQGQWRFLRLYACDEHATTVLKVIEQEGFSFKVMLGAYITAEVNNPNCPWGGTYPEKVLKKNKAFNEQEIDRLIQLAFRYPAIINIVSIGNEAAVDWTDHLVPLDSLLRYATKVKECIPQPVTFCENYVPWLNKLKPLGKILDLIAIHTYPVWEYKSIEEGLAVTKANYQAAADAYPGKQIIITEAGWATQSNGRGIEPHQVNEEFQARYFKELMQWAEEQEILVYYFEAFDEAWKGSDHPQEPEKHWGLYRTNRKPKRALAEGVL